MAELDAVVPGEPVDANTFGNPVVVRVLSRYIDATERDFRVPVPNAGDPAYLTSSGELQIYDGARWVTYSVTDLGGEIDLGGELRFPFEAEGFGAIYAYVQPGADRQILIIEARPEDASGPLGGTRIQMYGGKDRGSVGDEPTEFAIYDSLNRNRLDAQSDPDLLRILSTPFQALLGHEGEFLVVGDQIIVGDNAARLRLDRSNLPSAWDFAQGSGGSDPGSHVLIRSIDAGDVATNRVRIDSDRFRFLSDFTLQWDGGVVPGRVERLSAIGWENLTGDRNRIFAEATGVAFAPEFSGGNTYGRMRETDVSAYAPSTSNSANVWHTTSAIIGPFFAGGSSLEIKRDVRPWNPAQAHVPVIPTSKRGIRAEAVHAYDPGKVLDVVAFEFESIPDAERGRTLPYLGAVVEQVLEAFPQAVEWSVAEGDLGDGSAYEPVATGVDWRVIALAQNELLRDLVSRVEALEEVN